MDEPAKLPERPAIIINDTAMPRYFEGNRLTPTAIAILAHEPKHMNSKKLTIVHLNSVKMSSVRHAIIDVISQIPGEKISKKFVENWLQEKYKCFQTHRKGTSVKLASAKCLIEPRLWSTQFQWQAIFRTWICYRGLSCYT